MAHAGHQRAECSQLLGVLEALLELLALGAQPRAQLDAIDERSEERSAGMADHARFVGARFDRCECRGFVVGEVADR